MLAGAVEFVIGVDTHRDSHTAAVVAAATGGVVEHLTVPTDAFGYRRLKTFADRHAEGVRVWAVEGTGSYGAGLTTFLLERGEWVVEIDRPARPARRDGAKSDDLDAVRAAREALSREHPCRTPSTRRSGSAPRLDGRSSRRRGRTHQGDRAVKGPHRQRTAGAA
jgi:transposase